MIQPVVVRGPATQAGFGLTAAGMTVTISAGWYENGLGRVEWPASIIEFPSPAVDHNVEVWICDGGSIRCLTTPAPHRPAAPPDGRERLAWGVIPAGVSDLADAEISVLTLVTEDGEPWPDPEEALPEGTVQVSPEQVPPPAPRPSPLEAELAEQRDQLTAQAEAIAAMFEAFMMGGG